MGVFDLFRHRQHQEPTMVDKLEEQTSATDIAALPAPKGLEEKQPVKYCASCGEAVNVGTIACGKCGSGRLVTHKTHLEIRKKKASATGGKTHSLGVPLQYKCEMCGQMLHGGTGGIVAGGPEVMDHLFKRVKRCPSCGKIFCGKCSIETDNKIGRPKGAVDFTCPFCRTTGIPG